MKKCIVSAVFAALIGAALVAQAKPVVVVAPFDTKGVAQDEAEVITELFTAEYANTGSASVVDRNSFDKIKTQLSFQSSDWSNADKVAQLGKALNANHVVVGQLLQFRGQIITTIKIIDVNTTTILASYTEKVKDIEALLDELPEICIALSSKAGSVSKTEYKIGDRGQGGGIVFYVSSEGFDVHDGKGGVMRCHYLEMSKKNLGESKWGDYIALDNTSLGYGKHNTYEIVKHMGRTSVEKCAAYRCMQYKTATSQAGEWFLPNLEEVKLMIETQSEQLNTESTDNRWWASSSFTWDDWHIVHIFDAYKAMSSIFMGFDADRIRSVRAVRAF